MKFNFTQAFLCLTVVVSSFTACKKSALSPLSTPDDPKMDSLVSQVATGFIRSFNGKLGAININDGIKAPAKVAAIRRGPVVASIQPMCGSVIDTNYMSTIIAGDTTKFASEKFNFIYTCSTNYLDGYKVTDTVENRKVGTGFYSDSTFSENLVVQATDNTYKLASVSGNSSVYSYKGKTAPANIPTGFTRSTQSYSFFDTQVDLSTGTPYFSGEAQFIINATDINGKSVRYSGIMFFGKTTIVMNVDMPNSANATNGESYNVDLLTGKVKFAKYF